MADQELKVQVLRPIQGTARKYKPGEIFPATEFRNHTNLARIGKVRYCDTPTGRPTAQPAGAPAVQAEIARHAPPVDAPTASAPEVVQEEKPVGESEKTRRFRGAR